MTGSVHAGIGVLAAVFTAAVFLVRWALTPVPVRAPRLRPVEEWVPAHVLIPALAVHGPGWPTAAFRHCVGCQRVVPVVVRDGAHRCDAHGHVTINTTTGSTR